MSAQIVGWQLVQCSLYTGVTGDVVLQVVMMVEVLPITPSPICALCWLPGTMTQANKHLIKPLVGP